MAGCPLLPGLSSPEKTEAIERPDFATKLIIFANKRESALLVLRYATFRFNHCSIFVKKL